MSVRTVVKDLLEADGTIATLLTGGVYATREISRELTAAVFDANSELQPAALVKLGPDTAIGPDEIGSQQLVDIYLYERDGFTTIDQALARVYSLLHRQKIGDASDRIYEARHVQDIPDQEDAALNCSLALARYEVIRNRG